MATTLQQIITSLQGAGISGLPAGKVQAGVRLTGGNTPPYIAVLGFESVPDYDTGGVALKESTFRVVVIHKDADQAETLAALVDGYLNLSTTLTTKTMRCYLERWRSDQQDENLAQWGVELSYRLEESS